MKTTKLPDGTRVYALRAPEARMLDHHVDGYLQNGIEINDGDVVFDVGANIGVFSVRAAQKGPNVRVFAFEPIPFISFSKFFINICMPSLFKFVRIILPIKYTLDCFKLLRILVWSPLVIVSINFFRFWQRNF